MNQNYHIGITYALGAYGLWGILPIYWKQLHNVPALEILANRFIWSLFFVVILIVFLHKKREFLEETKAIFSSFRSSLYMILAAVMIAFNWGIFIWAVEDGRILETSLGYYINPMLSVVMGLIFLKEKLSRVQWFAVGFACAGVLCMVIRTGYLPWVSIAIPLTFSFYGLLKKFIKASPFTSILLETLIISPLALAYIYNLGAQDASSYQTQGSATIALLAGAGIVTATPLLLFTAGARILPLNIVGFMQYISPSISMIIGIFMYGEVFTFTHLLTFSLIWIGLLLFTYSQYRRV